MNNLGITCVWCALQVTLFAMAGSVIYGVRRRSSPRAASAVLLTCLVMIAVITAMAFSSWNGLWNVFPLATQRADEASQPSMANVSTADDGLPETRRRLAPKSHGTAGDPIAVHAAEFWRSFLRELADVRTQDGGFSLRWPVVWAGIVVLCSMLGIVRLLAGLFAIKRYRSESRPIQDAGLAAMTRGLGAKLGVRDEVEPRESSRLTTAATVGWRRPLILLPCQWREWTDQERRAVLAHELAHIRARDFPSWLAAQIGVVLHFYHPLVHWLAGRLRLEQELAADATAAEIAGGSRAYLETLGHMALRESNHALSWPARSFLPSRKTFMRRIEMLRNRPLGSRTSPTSSRQLVMVGLVIAIGLLIAGIRSSDIGGQSAAAAAAPTGAAAPDRSFEAADAQEGEPMDVQLGFEDISDFVLAFDLSLVPQNAIIVYGFRPAEIFKSPEIKPTARMVNEIIQLDPTTIAGISRVEQLEQCLIMAYGDLGKWKQVRVVLRSLTPVDISEITRAFATRIGEPVEETFMGKTYYRVKNDPDGEGFMLLDAQTVVADRVAGLKELLATQPDQRRSPVWTNRWRALEPSHFIVAIDLATLHAGTIDQDRLRYVIPLQFAGSLLKETQFLLLAASISSQVKLDGVAACRSAEGAKRVQETLQALVVLWRNEIGEERRTLAGVPQQEAKGAQVAFDLADQLLANAKFATNGMDVEAHASSQLAAASAIEFLLPAVAAAREAGRRTQGANNLKQIAIAMHTYHDGKGSLPPAVLYGPDGKTPHSWRVAILPTLGMDALYKEYKLDQPWDSPHNVKLLEKIPAFYRSPNDNPGSTNAAYFVLTGPETVFRGKEGIRLAQIQISDGTSNTLMLVEAKRDIPWTKPEDIPYDTDKPLPMLGGFHREGFSAAFCDGSVQFISKSIDEPVLRAMITKDGGEANPRAPEAVPKP